MANTESATLKVILYWSSISQHFHVYNNYSGILCLTGERLPCPHENCQYETLYRRALKHHMSSVHATSKDFQCDVRIFYKSLQHQAH